MHTLLFARDGRLAFPLASSQVGSQIAAGLRRRGRTVENDKNSRAIIAVYLCTDVTVYARACIICSLLAARSRSIEKLNSRGEKLANWVRWYYQKFNFK